MKTVYINGRSFALTTHGRVAQSGAVGKYRKKVGGGSFKILTTCPTIWTPSHSRDRITTILVRKSSSHKPQSNFEVLEKHGA